ncbi:MAG: DUF3365 domain-containing protein [Lentimicrobium sp.]
MKKFPTFEAMAFLVMLFLASCNPKQQQNSAAGNEIDTLAFIRNGDSIANAMQEVLLKNVIQATQKGGPVYAVAFCNERAMPLTDSLSGEYNCQIQRISDKYRNPANKPNEYDEAVILKMKSSNPAKPFLGSENGNTIYYKPIKIAMPACLNCHGTEGREIAMKTLEAIRQKYPNDLATGYKEGDFRGMWKITFRKEK